MIQFLVNIFGSSLFIFLTFVIKIFSLKLIRFSIIVALLGLFSCESSKNIIYLQNDSIDLDKVSNNYELTLKPDDLLQITVSSDDLESVIPFNLPVVTPSVGVNMAVGQPALQNYLIDRNGYIEFPVIGAVKIGGLTRIEAIEMLKKKISPGYVKNPIINIVITNFKVTVQGEVRSPGTFTFPNERVSIFDALGTAGDLNISARRDSILILREELGSKKIYRVDLKSRSILTSPAYYLQQNDVVYVTPNSARVQDAAYSRNIGFFVSIASVLISLLTIITR